MRSNFPGGSAPADFDTWLEGELPPLLSGAGSGDEPRYLRVRAARPHWRLRLASVPAMLGSKLLVGAGVLALAGAGVGVKTAVTGSPSPLVWSRGAQSTVQACQSSSPTDVGSCVSSAEAHSHAPGSAPGLANKGGTSPPGQAVSASKQASAQARKSASGHATSHSTGNSNPTKPASPTPHPHPSPSGSSQSQTVK